MSKSSGISSNSSYEAGMLLFYKDGVITDPVEARQAREKEDFMSYLGLVKKEEDDLLPGLEDSDEDGTEVDELNQAFVDPDKTLVISEEQQEEWAAQRERRRKEIMMVREREREINNLGWHAINNDEYTFLSRFFSREEILKKMTKN